MEEFRARVSAGVRHGYILKDDVNYNLQVGLGKGLPEKAPTPLDLAKVDALMLKLAGKLGDEAHYNRLYNEGRISKAEWSQSINDYRQQQAADAAAKQAQRAAVALTIAQGLNEASDNMQRQAELNAYQQRTSVLSRPVQVQHSGTIYVAPRYY